MTQEQINALRQDIVNVTRQIQVLSGPEFADTVPEIGTAKAALEAYKAEAERQVAEYEAARTALQSIFGRLLQNAAASAPAAR